MLTKDDLALIRKVVREEVETEVKDSSRTLETQIIKSRMEQQREMGELDDRMKNVEIRVDGLRKYVKDVKKDVKYIKKTLDVAIKVFNEEHTKLAKKVKRTEDHLDLPSL